MANDDIITPTKLVGKKIAPIYQYNDLIMAEILDIINYLDTNPLYGPTNTIAPFTGRTDINAWQRSDLYVIHYDDCNVHDMSQQVYYQNFNN
jgi:glutaredoxin 2